MWLLRQLALILALFTAFGETLPAWALFAGGPEAHVCHCSADHHECSCAKCDPSRGLTDDEALSVDTLTGHCGDDDVPFGSKAWWAIVPPTISPLHAPPSQLVPDGRERPPSCLGTPPPSPPPKSSTVS